MRMPKFFQTILLLLFWVLPWTVEFSVGSSKINLPSEGLIGMAAVVLVLFFFKKTWQNELDFAKFFSSKILIVSFLWIFWQGVTVIFSAQPMVSAKYYLVEVSHWWVFFVGIFIFPNIWERGLPILIISMAGMVSFAMTTHSFYDFRPDQSNLAAMPFFPDHTMFSAVLAMLLPFLFIQKKSSYWQRGGQYFLIFWLLLGIYFSFCRAAWASLVLVSLLLACLFFLEKWQGFVQKNAIFKTLFVVLLLIFSIFQIKEHIRNNEITSDGNARDVRGQVLSMINFKTDVSILERLNRYRCALRMAAERPMTGFGVGTFQFEYLAFQRREDMTRISVTAPISERNPSNFGRGGGAHSQYFQALAETGWVGLLLWLGLIFMTIWQCFSFIFFEKKIKKQANQVWVLLASLLTFWIHTLANDFLHDGRVAAIFWGILAWFSNFYENVKK